jgi:hypothetical protein
VSNTLAVATVTAAITTMVEMAVGTVGITPGPVVSPGTLEDVGDNARVSIHLYRVSRNPALSNAGLAVRNSAGDLRTRPEVALELHYLLCFRATSELDAQTMLAVTAATLETNPGISDELLRLTETDHPEVVGNDLREAAEPVRVCAEGLSVDELTRLWALYAAGSFALTLAVSASPVLVAVVLNGKQPLLAAPHGRNFYARRPVAAVLDRVSDQILKHLSQLKFMHAHAGESCAAD